MKRGLVARSCAREGRKDVGVGSRTIATMRRQFRATPFVVEVDLKIRLLRNLQLVE